MNKVNPIAALTSGKITSAHIGKTVYLSNSAITCQEWVIADVNHDGTSGTVDLFGKYVLNNNDFSIQYNTVYSSVYKGSNLDNYLESTVYNGFTTEVKNALNNMNVVSNGETLQRHVVAPSLREVGNNYPDHVLEEGTIYPIFSPASNPNSKSIFKRPSENGYTWYWTRSRFTGYSGDVWRVLGNGSAGNCTYDIGNHVVARLRFAVK